MELKINKSDFDQSVQIMMKIYQNLIKEREKFLKTKELLVSDWKGETLRGVKSDGELLEKEFQKIVNHFYQLQMNLKDTKENMEFADDKVANDISTN